MSKKAKQFFEAELASARVSAKADLAALCEAEGIYREGGKMEPEWLMALALRQSQRAELFADHGGIRRSLLHDALFNVNELRDLIMESRPRSVQ